MGCTKTGDWAKIDRMFAGVGERFRKNIEAATKKNGVLLKTAIITTFEQQGPGWQAHSPAYAKRKRKMGKEQILITTGQLMGSVNSHYPAWNEGFVGVKKGTTTKGGQDIVNLAAVHEFGAPSRKIPARPFNTPAGEKSRDQVVKNYEDAVEKTFRH